MKSILELNKEQIVIKQNELFNQLKLKGIESIV